MSLLGWCTPQSARIVILGMFTNINSRSNFCIWNFLFFLDIYIITALLKTIIMSMDVISC